jgi:hypothetical protein
MPFDMAHLRFPITYNLPENSSGEVRQAQREAMVKTFEKALKLVFESEEFKAKLPKEPEPPLDPVQEVIRLVPELTNEMRADLETPEGKLVREFFVLPNHSVMLGGSSKPRFIYYEDDNPNIMSQLDLLEEHGLVKDVTPDGNNTPIYRMSEKLVAQLRATSQTTQE